jgi:putative ABC transport system permease protein
VRSVPVGRRNLFVERRRAILGIAGVATAVLLVLALDGILAGATKQLTRYIDTSQADVFVAQAGVKNMHMATSSIPARDVITIRRLPEVEWADPVLYIPDALVTPGGGRQLAYVIGYPSTGHGGPVELATGAVPGPGEIVLDDRAAATRDAHGVHGASRGSPHR